MNEDESKEFHQNDTEKDIISDYYQGYQQEELQSAESQVRKSRNALFIIAGLTLVYSLVVLARQGQLYSIQLILSFVLAFIFMGLGFLTKKQPFNAIVIGLVIYAGVWLVNIITVGPEEFIRGFIFKAIIIYFLVAGLRYAREAERLKKEIDRK